MTGTLIAPVIPSAAAESRPARAHTVARTLPLAVAPALSRPPALGRDMVYGLARVDRSGRVADRTVTGALGWRGGDRLTLTAEAGVVVIRRDSSGLVTLPPRSCVPIPAALRHRCGLLPGDPVLLAAVPAEDTLTAYSLAVVDQALAAHIPVVSALVSDGCRKAYGSYWNRVTEQWGSRRIDEPTPSEIRQLVQHVRANVVPRRNSRGGRSAAEHLIAALRCMYKHAEEDGLINPADNPARKVEKPRRLPTTRRAVADKRLAEINHAAATTGDDPELDTLLLRLHTETACRRSGALALRPQDLDPEQCLILLREKGETVRCSQSHPPSWPPSCGTPGNATRHRTGDCCATATAAASPTAAVTTCGNASAGTCPGYGRYSRIPASEEADQYSRFLGFLGP